MLSCCSSNMDYSSNRVIYVSLHLSLWRVILLWEQKKNEVLKGPKQKKMKKKKEDKTKE